MAKIVNLRQARKKMVRVSKREAATSNAAKHGLSKADRAAEAEAEARAKAHLDAHKRDPH